MTPSSPQSHRLTAALLGLWSSRLDNETCDALLFRFHSLPPEEAAELFLLLGEHPAPGVRIRAAAALVRQGHPEGLARLEKLRRLNLGWQDRQLLAEAFGLSPTPEALGSLLEMIKDSDYDVRASVVKSIGLVGQVSAVPVLEQVLQGEHDLVMAYALEALAGLAPLPEVETLLQMAEQDNPFQQYLGGYGLLQSRNPKGIDVLSKLARREEGNECLPRIAATALCAGKTRLPGRTVLSLTRSKNPYVRACAAKLMGQTPEAFMPQLFELLEDRTDFKLKTYDPLLFNLSAWAPLNVGVVAARMLAGVHQAQVGEKLLEFARNASGVPKRIAIQALTEWAAPESDATILAWLADPAPQVRQAAAEICARRGMAQAVDRLLELAHDDDFIEVRASAVLALGNAQEDWVVGWLVQYLDDPAWQAQFNAALHLERRAPQAADFLIQKLASLQNREAQGRVIWMLDKLGNSPAVRATILAWGTADSAIWQRTVAEAVKANDRTVSGVLAGVLHDPDAHIREVAVEALGSLGDREVVLPLAELLADPEWPVRVTTLAALAKIAAEASDRLELGLQTGNRKVRAGIAELLGRLKTPQALALLIRTLNDPCRLVRASAAAALANFEDPRALEALQQALQDPDHGVRNLAAGALRHMNTPAARAAVHQWTLARRRQG